MVNKDVYITDWMKINLEKPVPETDNRIEWIRIVHNAASLKGRKAEDKAGIKTMWYVTL